MINVSPKDFNGNTRLIVIGIGLVVVGLIIADYYWRIKVNQKQHEMLAEKIDQLQEQTNK